MDIKKGYYQFQKPLEVAEKIIECQELPHDPASEQTLFSLSITELREESERGGRTSERTREFLKMCQTRYPPPGAQIL
jgi:hypothetical protein